MFGENIQQLRKERKMTQAQLAEYLGLSCAAIYKYERNLAEPDIESMIKIADLFECSIDYLVGRTEWKSPTSLEVEQDRRAARKAIENTTLLQSTQTDSISEAIQQLIRTEIEKALNERR